MKNGPRLRGSIGGWALGWAIAAALTLLAGFSSRYYAAAPTFLLALAGAGFGLGALIAARAREFESERSAAGLEGVIWGTACLGMLLLWFYWVPAPPREVLGKPGEVNEVWIDPHQPRESHGRSIHFAPALVRAFETFVWFGVVGGLLSTAARLGRRALEITAAVRWWCDLRGDSHTPWPPIRSSSLSIFCSMEWRVSSGRRPSTSGQRWAGRSADRSLVPSANR